MTDDTRMAEGSTWDQNYALALSKLDLRDLTLKINGLGHEFLQSVHEANN